VSGAVVEDQMNNHETIVERSIEREMRVQVCSMDDYRQADREHQS
jgi:hypothetical protein